jgi:hypothetical protein
MTCREFKHSAASLSLLELVKMEDPQMAEHAQACTGCGSWVQKQRTLNASMHALRARTAGLEAGPSVERALLSVFRQGIPVASTAPPLAEVAVIGMKGPLETLRPHSKAAPRSTPFALRLSRMFEIGAYAAVAAAILVALFLGVHLLRRNSVQPTQSKLVPERTVPAIQQPTTNRNGSRVAAVPGEIANAGARHREVRSRSTSASDRQAGSHSTEVISADDSQSDADEEYMALMLCDPLSCATDTQVVRMELPGPAGAEGVQPKVADMVVGYDGVVRAVRFQN